MTDQVDGRNGLEKVDRGLPDDSGGKTEKTKQMDGCTTVGRTVNEQGNPSKLKIGSEWALKTTETDDTDLNKDKMAARQRHVQQNE